MSRKTTRETAIKRQVKNYLNLMGWSYYHNLQGLGCYPGLADIVAMKDGVTVHIEIKTETGKLSDNQKKFRDMVLGAECYYIVARSYSDVESFIKSVSQKDQRR